MPDRSTGPAASSDLSSVLADQGLTLDDVGWTPHPGQHGAATSSQGYFVLIEAIREVLYHGTRGNGKTEALLMAYARHVGRGFGDRWVGIIFREEYKEFEDLILKSKRLFGRIFPDAKFKSSKGDLKWTWPTGEQLMFHVGKKASDYWRYHGQEIPFLGFEELCNQKDLDFYLAMHSCCRSSIPGMPRIIRATTNPFGPGHHAVKDRFINAAEPGEVVTEEFENPVTGETITQSRMHIWGHWSENQYLTENDPDYIAALMADRNRERRKAWVLGLWDIAAGAMLGDVWDERVHWINPFPIPPQWRVFRSLDYGWSAPFSIGWWAVSDGSDIRLPDGSWLSTVRGDMFRIREWYGFTGKPNEGVKMLAPKISEGIVERELLWGLYGRVSAGPADHDIFSKEKGISYADEMKKRVRLEGHKKLYKGVRWKKADKRPGTRKSGREAIVRRHAHAVPEDGRPREKPGIFIFTHCKQYRRIMPTLPIWEKDPDDIDPESENHVWDETRYAISEVEGSQQGTTSTTTGYY